MEYHASRFIAHSPAEVWRQVSRLRHFAENDPYHTDLRFTSAHEEGLGAAFKVRHSYWPAFPLRPDTVTCIVQEWHPGLSLVLQEINADPRRRHSQSFTLRGAFGGTLLEFRIEFPGFPRWLAWWKPLARRSVQRRMREKLAHLDASCGTPNGSLT